jgi:mannosyl-3-phosphoglycerate phosphatase
MAIAGTASAERESPNSAPTVIVFAKIDDRFRAEATSPAGAVKGGARLAAEHVGLVLCSSMTRAELEMIEHELGINQPFICESGAAILVPGNYFPFDVPCHRQLPGYRVIDFGRPYADVVAVLHRTARRAHTAVIGFNDLSVEQVAQERGLSLSQARLAKLREYDEPFRLLDPSPKAYDRLWRSLRTAGLACTARGTYEHVGAPISLPTSVSVLTDLYRRASPACVTVGLGTGPWRSQLFRGVELAFTTASKSGELPAVRAPDTPHLEPGLTGTDWLGTILELARRARAMANG